MSIDDMIIGRIKYGEGRWCVYSWATDCYCTFKRRCDALSFMRLLCEQLAVRHLRDRIYLVDVERKMQTIRK